jgi:hypothetical protein
LASPARLSQQTVRLHGFCIHIPHIPLIYVIAPWPPHRGHPDPGLLHPDARIISGYRDIPETHLKKWLNIRRIKAQIVGKG